MVDLPHSCGDMPVFSLKARVKAGRVAYPTSDGTEQVGRAVMQRDQVTQQNASLVEEAAAASESLQRQGDELIRAVAVFRLDPALGGPSPAEGLPTRRAPAAGRELAARPRALRLGRAAGLAQ